MQRLSSRQSGHETLDPQESLSTSPASTMQMVLIGMEDSSIAVDVGFDEAQASWFFSIGAAFVAKTW